MSSSPNILIFFVDQQRGDSVHPYARAITPNTDRLARDGVTFSQAFCPSPHCSPSRATFWTGLYPSQHGTWNNVNVGNALTRGLYDGVRCWTEFVDQDLYRRLTYGKWHVSAHQSPSERGFENDVGFGRKLTDRQGRFSATAPPSTHEWQKHRDRVRNSSPDRKAQPGAVAGGWIERSGYRSFHLYGHNPAAPEPGKMVDAAVAFLEDGARDPDQPWLLHVGVGATHDPYFAPKQFYDLYEDREIELPASYEDRMRDKPAMYRRIRQRFDQLSREETRECIRHYLATCTLVDYQFGVVLDALERTGEADNTVVLYIADHGDYMGEHGLWAKGLPCFRGAYHVPCIMRWPKGIRTAGRVVDAFVSLADFAPTFLEILGVPHSQEFAGRSLVPFLQDEAPPDWRKAMHFQSNGNEQYGIQRAVMTRKWKLVHNGFDFDELYDLESDPDETTNVYDRPGNAQTVRDLYGELWRFAYEHDDVYVNEYIMCALADHGPGVIFEDE